MKDFQIIFLSGSDPTPYVPDMFLIFSVLRKTVRLTASGKTHLLEPGDLMILNDGERVLLSSDPDSLTAVIGIRAGLVRGLARSEDLFFPDSALSETGTKYEKFCQVVQDLLGEYASGDNTLDCRKLSCLYRILDSMLRYFAVYRASADTGSDAFRAETAYIRSHYMENLSLEEMAGRAYMTPSAYSRKFKSLYGMTFSSFLSGLRLQHALDMLIGTDLPVAEVALQSGYNSVSHFNKVFRETYGLSPRAYKEERRNTAAAAEIPRDVTETLQQFRVKTRMTVVKRQKSRLVNAELDTSGGTRLHNPWGNLISLGFASHLLSGQYQNQIAYLKKTLHFTYGAINGLFSPEMRLLSEDDPGSLSFTRLDQVLDFLVENEIRPLIVYDDRALSAYSERAESNLLTINCISSLAQFKMVTDAIMDHLFYRYGAREVSTWKFSLWYYTHTGSIFSLADPFLSVWDTFYECIRSRSSSTEVGGLSCGPSDYENTNDLLAFYTTWAGARHIPDFLTLFEFPYKTLRREDGMGTVRVRIDSFLEDDLLKMKAVLHDAGFPHRPVIISEWNLSIVQTSTFNDMAGKAAIMAQQMASSIGTVDEICYWYASDLVSENVKADTPLHGGCGLLTADGICKPAYYVLRFLHDLFPYVVDRGRNYIVTKDGQGRFAILLYNHKPLSLRYYNMEEEKITPADEGDIFIDHDALEITLTLRQMENRTYRIRRQLIGPSHGSVLDEWLHLGSETHPPYEDLQYLRHRCIPLRTNDTTHVEDNTLTIYETLAEHEVMLLKLV
ncbi:MAG: helix-turn-helix domain-containing protein [Clostridia bacterium]|nr:helix-turn-helix domain-containing protein [Clostridia bacterium]